MAMEIKTEWLGNVTIDRSSTSEEIGIVIYTLFMEYDPHASDIDLVKTLLDWAGTHPDSMPKYDGENRLLHWVALRGWIEAAELLLDRGSAVDQVDLFGMTPLHKAAKRGHLDMCRLLIDRGAEIDSLDRYEFTPLWVAATWKMVEAAKLLITRGADPLKVFRTHRKVLDFFRGDIDWMPEGDLKTRLQKTHRGASMFGV